MSFFARVGFVPCRLVAMFVTGGNELDANLSLEGNGAEVTQEPTNKPIAQGDG
jgi:hypothetical protein